MPHLPDLSLRHLPDLSDTSFQIPVSNGTDELLLADPSGDFLADADSLGTPIMPKKTHDALRLSDLTPRPESKQILPPSPRAVLEQPTIHAVSRPSKTKSKPTESREASTSALRPSTQDQDTVGADDKAAPIIDRPARRRPGNKPALTRKHPGGSGDAESSKQAVYKRGEIIADAPSSAISDVPPTITAVRPEDGHGTTPSQVKKATMKSDFLDASFGDVTMDAAVGGAAGRLLMFSQGIMQSMTMGGGYGDDRQAIQVADTDAPPATRDDPLTLSQLSPRKKEVGQPQEPISPMRTSNKRPASPQSILDSSEPRKREKRLHPGKPKSNAASLKSSRDKVRKPASTRSKFKNSKENALTPAPPREHFDHDQTRERIGRTLDTQADKEKDSHVLAIGQRSISDRPNNQLPPPKAIQPIEFNFKSELRLESRKAQHEEGSRSTMKRSASRFFHPVPDFKALHAAHEASVAARKEHIAPVVPQPLQLSTEIRAKEREKFEEARRAREQEIERQMEERRRQKELEEEKEIRELRKRAVPKANAIPHWYADAPKKKGGSVGS